MFFDSDRFYMSTTSSNLIPTQTPVPLTETLMKFSPNDRNLRHSTKKSRGEGSTDDEHV